MRLSELFRSLALLLLLPSVAALPVLAYASPPDPSWIQGIFDGADYDDVVVLVAATVSLIDTFLGRALAQSTSDRQRSSARGERWIDYSVFSAPTSGPSGSVAPFSSGNSAPCGLDGT